jgi:hypothetical protein
VLPQNTVDLKVGNFRASYLDFRPLADLTNRGPSVHVEPDYARQAINAFLDIGNENATGPDVVHLEMPIFGFSTRIGEYTGLIRAWLGADWAGQFLVSLGKIPAKRYATLAAGAWYKRPELFDWLDARHKNLEIGVVDETSMAAAVIHETIKVARAEGIHESGWSSHYHRPCKELGMHVCSPVCDNSAQQILNMAFRARRITPRFARTTPIKGCDGQNGGDNALKTSLPIQFCLRCPDDLVPFTITSPKSQQKVCHDYVPLSRSV